MNFYLIYLFANIHSPLQYVERTKNSLYFFQLWTFMMKCCFCFTLVCFHLGYWKFVAQHLVTLNITPALSIALTPTLFGHIKHGIHPLYTALTPTFFILMNWCKIAPEKVKRRMFFNKNFKLFVQFDHTLKKSSGDLDKFLLVSHVFLLDFLLFWEFSNNLFPSMLNPFWDDRPKRFIKFLVNR